MHSLELPFLSVFEQTLPHIVLFKVLPRASEVRDSSLGHDPGFQKSASARASASPSECERARGGTVYTCQWDFQIQTDLTNSLLDILSAHEVASIQKISLSLPFFLSFPTKAQLEESAQGRLQHDRGLNFPYMGLCGRFPQYWVFFGGPQAFEHFGVDIVDPLFMKITT